MCYDEVGLRVLSTNIIVKFTTQNMIFNVTYYLELHNAINVYHASHLSTNHGRIGCLDTIEHQHLYLVRKSLIVKDIGTCSFEQ